MERKSDPILLVSQADSMVSVYLSKFIVEMINDFKVVVELDKNSLMIRIDRRINEAYESVYISEGKYPCVF